MQDLQEFKALEDEDGRKVAFAKYIKRQKVIIHPSYLSMTIPMCLQEKLKEASEDGASTTSRKRKEPPEHEGSDRASYRERDERSSYKDRERDRDRDREREKDKERAHDRDARGREYEKDKHSTRHGREDYDRDRREYRDKDRDRDYYSHSSGRHRDSGRDR
jgi:pre-mRNA-processing factor 40